MTLGLPISLTEPAESPVKLNCVKIVEQLLKCLSVHSFSNFLLSFSNELGIVLEIGNDMVNNSAFIGFMLRWGNMKRKTSFKKFLLIMIRSVFEWGGLK